ncbi:hypothetical protein N3K66_004678 [Trichothecium roseum]|uniref:Uncharacterized protein n=1 Tax=Trichothecium roseum TaxID=47278 RepID=A0ACC0V2P9_9HYPO|nr:hypothetical protein N3K66_004678 [Trichothecium roseum]
MDKQDRSSSGSAGTPQFSSTTASRQNVASDASRNVTQNATRASTIATTDSARSSKHSSANNSSTHSPLPSREPSPTQNPRRTTSATRLRGPRSHKNSQQDLSPQRPVRPGVSGQASTPRSLSSTAIPPLQPAAEDMNIQSPTPRKPFAPPDFRENPRWPVSPRLRSPPPLGNNKPGVSPVRRNDQDIQGILQRPTPSPAPSDSQTQTSGSDTEDSQMHSGIRTPVRGGLETVQEVSLPNSPTPVSDAALLAQVKEKLSYPEHQSDGGNADRRTLRARPNIPAQESGSDSSTNKDEKRRSTSVPPPPLMTRNSSAMSSKHVKGRQEGSTQAMTVETETVTSIPQVALATGNKSEGPNGTLRSKQSTETIKPRKEKRRPTRKQPTVNSGNASSKADIFEAKIASAVDEQDTSDSEETFVYDSNPPDGGDRSARRFHSRTPSATSMASQADRQNLRSIYGVIDGGGHGPKKAMKFVNTFTGNGSDSLHPGEDDGRSSGRSNGGSGRGTTRHHHIGRWGRQPGNGLPSLFDSDSHFQKSKSKMNGASRNSSNPPSPRSYNGFGPKRSHHQMSSYDLDDTTGADDERTPLISSQRSARSSRYRRGPHNLRQAESQSYNRRPSYLNRFAACLVLTMMFLLVITGAIGFMFATSQPMMSIEIVTIKNVVTSDQVLMFDLTVKAHNPNIVVVTVDQANLEVFAKSEHAGTDSDWWKMPQGPDELRKLDDPVNDPPLDDPDDEIKPNVLLGRITEFDSPLTFEGSLFNKGSSQSSGEMQLAYPGNGTAGGSERWERIYQDEFDLILKGVVKYSLPLSGRVRSATVSGRTQVKPNSANDPSLEPNNTITELP